MDTFTELFVPLYHTLCNMKDNVEGEFRPNFVTDANLHLISISYFEFAATLVITRHVLDETLPVTQFNAARKGYRYNGWYPLNKFIER